MKHDSAAPARRRTGQCSWPSQLIVYALVGVGVLAVDLAVFTVLVRGAGWDALVVNPLSRTCGAVACFFGQRYVTFGCRDGRRIPRHALRFIVVFCLALLLSETYLWALHRLLGVPAEYAKLGAEALVFLGNFVLLRVWAFS